MEQERTCGFSVVFLFALLCLTVPLFTHRIEFHVLLLASVNVFTPAYMIMSPELLISCIMSLGGDGGKTKLKGVLIVYFRTKCLFFERVSV